MPGSFRLQTDGDGDAVLSIVLPAVTAVFMIVNVWINLSGFIVLMGPFIVFLVTRFAYKRHFRKRIAMLQSQFPGTT